MSSRKGIIPGFYSALSSFFSSAAFFAVEDLDEEEVFLAAPVFAVELFAEEVDFFAVADLEAVPDFEALVLEEAEEVFLAVPDLVPVLLAAEDVFLGAAFF